MKRTLLAILLCFIVADLKGQGFSTVNNRNHPEISWMQAETEHFLIMYPGHLEGIENEAAAIAEESYRILSQNLNVNFDHKIRIYLSDEDEIANGFAVPLGRFYTMIWVNVNDAAESWTGRTKWLRKVLAHELTHIFHFGAVKGTFWPLDYAIGNSIPGFWAEGLAQFQTEEWDAYRGDQWLRIASYDDGLDYRSGQSAWDGRLMYAVGNSQIRFFAEQYGDSTLAVLLAHRSPALLGIGRIHNFDAAFFEVTGESFSTFEDRWRRHINIYYHTMAGQMERLDSLSAEPLSLPSRHVYDIRTDSSGRYLTMVGLTSIVRPFVQLWLIDTQDGSSRVLDDGPVGNHSSWHPDGTWIAYHRTTRGRYGSLLNELYRVHAESGKKEQLTRNRRAAYPEWMHDGRLAFAGMQDGTSNIFALDVDTGAEEQLTFFGGDVQIAWIRRQPGGSLLAFYRFDEEGYREIILLDPESGDWHAIGDAEADNRRPVWSPDGSRIAFTSLRDQVPNIFITDPFSGGHETRVTRQFAGITAHSWLPADSLHPQGRLIVSATDTKTRNYVYEIDAGKRNDQPEVNINPSYTGWVSHRPDTLLAKQIPADPDLVLSRNTYCSWCSINHLVTMPLPYYFTRDDWGVAFFSAFFEPLGRHMIVGALGISAVDPVNEGFAWLNYMNRQLYPTLNATLYYRSYSARFYGDDLLIDRRTGFDLSADWPVDWFNMNFSSSSIGTEIRYHTVNPLREFSEIPEGLEPPESGKQALFKFRFTVQQKRPYRFERLHPLDGFGLNFQVTTGLNVLGGDTRFIRPDLKVYTILHPTSNHRIYIYGRAIMQEGNSLNQDFFGLTRYGDFSQSIPGINYDILYGDGERVRGYRDYVIRNRMLFTSLEYRIPVISNLQTSLLGFAVFSGVVIAPFVEGAIVWDGIFDYDSALKRAGTGLELKNLVTFSGLQINHAIGIGQPVQNLFSDKYEIYYRIKLAIPF